MHHDKRDGSSNDFVRPDHRKHKMGLVLVVVNVITVALMMVKELREKSINKKY